MKTIATIGRRRDSFFVHANGWPLVADFRPAPRSAIRRAIVAGLFALTLFPLPAFSQDAPEWVMIDGSTFSVNGDSVSAQNGSVEHDNSVVQKALFTARVLDEQIVHAKLNKDIFDPAFRAIVYRDEILGRLIEAWRRPLLNAGSDARLAVAKEKFKEWAAKLVSDPKAFVLAIANKEYLDGIAAYRENAAIYRGVMTRNQTLTFDDAMRFMRNEWFVARLAAAKGLERRLNDSSTAASWDRINTDGIRDRVKTEVVPLIDSAKSEYDLDVAENRMYAVVKSDPSMLQEKLFGDYVRSIELITLQIILWPEIVQR